MRRILPLGLLVALLLPAQALAAEEFDPEHEFQLPPWIPIHIGPLDLSINKAVAYLILGSLLSMAIGIFLMRVRIGVDPDTRQTIGEQIYDICQTQIAEGGLPSKAVGRWFPYVATLFIFIWSLNMLGFVPLPLTNPSDHVEILGVTVPALGIYAATAQISVTLVLAAMSVAFTHIEGVRWNGAGAYFKSWIPHGVPKALVPFLFTIEVLSHAVRVVSLSVRLFANMLAGHMLILVMLGLIIVLQTAFLALVTVPVATAFYLFEVVIVVNIQAFIFATLSAIYIGSAIEPDH
ncbi:MAG TPA: F0F1 ATP synthase subunit A [Gaiellaceae bacterium]|jgi:F-type H+-transporting ATPase subunit a|nr:F0F1 ATP synthase subunit A [Gaiellaceae bacterium]